MKVCEGDEILDAGIAKGCNAARQQGFGNLIIAAGAFGNAGNADVFSAAAFTIVCVFSRICCLLNRNNGYMVHLKNFIRLSIPCFYEECMKIFKIITPFPAALG